MLDRDIEKALLHVDQHGFGYSAMTLSKRAKRLREDKIPRSKLRGILSKFILCECYGNRDTIFPFSTEYGSLRGNSINVQFARFSEGRKEPNGSIPLLCMKTNRYDGPEVKSQVLLLYFAHLVFVFT